MRPIARFVIALALALPSSAATLIVRVQDVRGRPVNDAVVYAQPEGRELPLARRTAVMDQRNRTFVPHVLPVQKGTAVSFPNSDDVRHHVYSFSAAKTFQLPLYKGTPSNPEVFDRPGVVALGCNIHDQMSAYIVVVDTPYFAKTAAGISGIEGIEPGSYTIRAWVPESRLEPEGRRITVTGDETVSVILVVGRTNARP
jgi:plastocyanin